MATESDLPDQYWESDLGLNVPVQYPAAGSPPATGSFK